MFSLRALSGGLVGTPLVLVGFIASAGAQPADPLVSYRAQREAYAETFRVEGRGDHQRLTRIANEIEALVQSSSGQTRARALLELGLVWRLNGETTEALAALGRAVQEAASSGLNDVAFEAWIGIARAHDGASEHGAAAVALEHAADAAGEQPTLRQRVDLAGYRAQLELDRGETEAGLIDALRAAALTAEPKDRFFTEFDLGDGLQRLAASCDYRPLIDAKSSEDGAEVYGACRRAVAASRAAYERATATAASLGWTYMVNETNGLIHRLEMRRFLIEQKARGAAMDLASAFHPRSVKDVLVSRDFEAGASTLTDVPLLAKLVDSVLAEAAAQEPGPDARTLYMRGLSQDMRGAGPEAAAKFFAAAAELLGAERSGFFDPRRRGTVIENRGEIVRDLALRLLSLRREADAFAAFESVRARGLGELANALSRPDVSADDRIWLADLLVLEARTGAIERRIVADMVASGRMDAVEEKMRELDQLRAARNARLHANEAARARFAAAATLSPASLEALHAEATRTGIPVLLYWSTAANLVAWYVGPGGSEVRNVFVPASVLEEKIGRVLASSGGSFGRQQFDETAARELFLFLLTPFEVLLSPTAVKQIMIVPQGPLARLPFEALIDPVSGEAVIERWAISYAPSATMAVAAQRAEMRPVRNVTALVDPAIDDNTRETAAVQASGALLETVTRNELFAGSWQADSLHVLTHGEFNSAEALLSSVRATRSSDPPILAAELLALPLRGLSLAVLSACQGGQVGTRISGEIYGFPWALLAGGTKATVLSRWDVNGASNGQWMGVFYREVAGGVSPAMAGATAMREMRKAGLTHPYYWAAMQVSGR
jgi:hypothetical protein